MKWKRMKKKEIKISNEREDSAKHLKFVNIQKKSVIRGLLSTGPASRNTDAMELNKDSSCQKESRHSKEQELLHSKDLTCKKLRKRSHTEKPESGKKLEAVVKRRRRTKIEMALSCKARSPELLEHILEEVGYDCSANRERYVRGKSSNLSDCMKGRGGFWILDDNLIRNVQKKMGALENQNVISPPQLTTKSVPLVGLKCLSLQRPSLRLNKELDVVALGKTIIQVSHAPAKNRVMVAKEPSKALMQLESFSETDRVPPVNKLNTELAKAVQNKDTGVSGTFVEVIGQYLESVNSTERVHKENQSVIEKCGTGALEDVDVAGTSLSSTHRETQSDEMCLDDLIKSVHDTVRCFEDEAELDNSEITELPDLETESIKSVQNSGHSQPLIGRNTDGLTRLEDGNETLFEGKEMISRPRVTVERVPQEPFSLGSDNHLNRIQTNLDSDVQADICFLNSVSLARCGNVGTGVINDNERGVKSPSPQLEMDVHRMHRRKRKQLFTRRKKCKSTDGGKFKHPSADSWSYQSSITDQVLSGCRLVESGRAGEMEISPEVESAASVLAMMSAGGRMFTGIQHGDGHWENGESWKKYPAIANAALADFRQLGTYMCDVCGHVFMDSDMLRQHMSVHERSANQKKSTLRKQLRHKQTTTKAKVQQTSLSDEPSLSAVKSCASVIDDTDKQAQNLECEVQQSSDQPVAAVTKAAIFTGVNLSQGNDASQIVEAEHGGATANASGGSVNKVVKFTESQCDKSEIALKDVHINQDDGILHTVEVDQDQRSETAPPANAGSVMSKDTAQRDVTLNQKLSDKTGVDSTTQTSFTSSRAVVGAQNTMKISGNEEFIRVENAQNDVLYFKGVSKSKLVGQDRCERKQNEITNLSQGSTKELNAANLRPESSKSLILSPQLSELVELVVDTMKKSGSVFGSSLSTRVITGIHWSSNTCCICNRKFSSAANARKHIRMQHNAYKPHKCKICDKGFPYPSSLLEHMTSHAADPLKLVCDICGKVFVRQSGLRKHIKEQHEGSRPHVCNICDKSFVYRCLLREHQRSHSDERTFKCTKCDCVFKQMSNLLMHTKKRHENVCECPAGNCTCPPKAARPLPSYTCVVCSKMFVQRKQLELHLERHEGKKPLACRICEKEFPNKFALSKHRMKHQETKTFNCEVCNRTFLSKPALKSHRRTHGGIKPYQCESCGKQYTTKNSLKIHSIRHLEVLPHACDKCNKKFALRANLTKHMASHTKEHVFICCHCDQTFHCNTDLKKHILEHEEQKTYVCLYCSKKFLHQSNLNMHVVKHTGERPHSCGVCGRCFSLKANLRRHMQTHMRRNGHIIAESSIPIPGAYVVLGSE